MAENSGIEWTTHTFNPWIGCTKVSPACDHCYAAEWDKRYEGGIHWGPKAPRRRTEEKNWNKPLKWNREAAASGVRPRVFCASLADVFDNQVPEEWRADLWALIRATPNLDWLLLTKRAPNIKKMLPDDWQDGYKNVWLGTTVENQEEWDRRGKHLLAIPAVVRFLSCEPLLGLLDLRFPTGAYKMPPFPDDMADWTEAKRDDWFNMQARATYIARTKIVDWVITGGESGSHFRHADPDWFRSLRDQCAAAGVAFLFKQWEGISQTVIKKMGRELDGVVHDSYPTPRA